MKLKLMMSSAVASLAVLTISCSRQADPAIPQDAQVEKKVENVLSSMSLEDKAGQLVQITKSAPWSAATGSDLS